jgi:Uma2 family endonuclease
MAVATAPQLLTYEEYLAEGEVMQRYDIVDGVREVTNPTQRHNDITLQLIRLFDRYAESAGTCRVLVAPRDILIRKRPLRTRQPDLSLITRERLLRCPSLDDPAPLPIGPELVVEVLSPSDTRAVRTAKLEDFCAAGVAECWVIAPGPRTVEVLRLSLSGMETVALYGEGQEVASVVFPGLRVSVTTIFAEI